MCKLLWSIVAVGALTFVVDPGQAQASWLSQALQSYQYGPGSYYYPNQVYGYQGQSNYYQPGYGYNGLTYQSYSYPQGYGNYQTPYSMPQYQGYGNYGYPNVYGDPGYRSYYNNPQWQQDWQIYMHRQYGR